MKNILTLVLATALIVISLSAWNTNHGNEFVVRNSDSRVTFTLSKWTVFKEEGRFTDFGGRIHYHPEDPSELRVNFHVDVGSIETHNNVRNARLQKEDFFDSDNYPRMEFASTSVVKNDDGTLSVSGNLTIKGTTRKITIPVTPLGIANVEDLGTIAGFETQFRINRMDYNVTGHSWSDGRNILGHEVDVRVLVSASRR